MFCKYCGTKIPDDVEFCLSCGGRIKAETNKTIGDNTDTLIADAVKGDAKTKPKKWYAKPWLYIALAVVIAVAVLAVTGVGADIVTFVLEGPAVPISFDSNKLEDAVREQLDIWDREVTNKDVVGVTELSFEGCGITGIEALAQFEDLTNLNLKNNQVRDLSPLEKLISLTQLNLQENRIDDISALSELCSLTDLQLSENTITDISALSEMTCLCKLLLEKNQINDISALAKLEGIKELDLSDNQISGVESLSGLKNLETLDLKNNNISDIKPISSLTKIKEVNLEDNQISDIAALSGCGCLTKLAVKNNPIEDISPASRIKDIKNIDIRGTKVKDISDVAGKVTIQMDKPETIELILQPGEFFMIENLKLPIDTGGAQITWTSSDESAVTVENDGKIQTTNVHPDAWGNTLYKEAVLTGKIENVSADIECHISISQDPYNYEWDEKKTTYKTGSWKMTGYACTVKPALENVIGVDFGYEVEIRKGKMSKFTLRAKVNGKWKNFGTVNVKETPEGTAYIDFGKTVEISKYWFIPKDKKSGSWYTGSAYFDTVYYALREADLGDLQADAE